MKFHRAFVLFVSQVFLGLAVASMLVSVALFTVWSHHASAESPSFVRVIHASPDIGTADVFVDGALLLSSFQFGAVTGYAAVPPGPHKVQIALVSKGINSAVLTQTLQVAPGAVYTVAATGTQSTNLALKVYVDNNRLAPNTSRLRIYQLSPDAGNLNVTTPQKSLITGIPYEIASNYLTVSPGDYHFTVTSPTSNASRSIDATLDANKITSLFAVGLVAGNPQFAVVSAQVDGVPGLPNTGSDPNPSVSPDNEQPFLPWTYGMLGMMAVLCMGGWGYLRQKAKKQS
ncbi:MAG TPA: DUF4397 domain-containing protein [Ktedonobacterales bacterium]|jgi:hypothetical protein